MRLYRLRLRIHSPWLTPWQSDTLAGLLCWALARTEGADVLQREILGPAAAGQPPFVLSDAFPHGLLPVPALLRAATWPADARKTVKRARWLPVEDFQCFQKGALPPLECLRSNADVLQPVLNLRNKLDRISGTTGGAGEGGLFSVRETYLARAWLKPDGQPERPAELEVYARVKTGFERRLAGLMLELSQSGFGADVSVGKGQFSLATQGLEPAPELDDVPDADGCIVLSTFQPAAGDPVDGAWETFIKYGKLGPDFGLENVFKRPLVLFRPGACFRGHAPQPWVGRSVPMAELLAPDAATALAARNTNVMHLAFGLALPAILK